MAEVDELLLPRAGVDLEGVRSYLQRGPAAGGYIAPQGHVPVDVGGGEFPRVVVSTGH